MPTTWSARVLGDAVGSKNMNLAVCPANMADITRGTSRNGRGNGRASTATSRFGTSVCTSISLLARGCRNSDCDIGRPDAEMDDTDDSSRKVYHLVDDAELKSVSFVRPPDEMDDTNGGIDDAYPAGR